jgi:hypothetical protein
VLLLLLLLLAATSAYSVSTMGQSNEPVQQFVIVVYVHMSCAPAGAAANSVDGVPNRVAGVAGVAAAAAAGGSVSLQLQHIQGGWDLVPNTCTAYCTDAWACPMLLQVLLRSVWMVQPTVLLVLLLLAVT